MYSWICIIAFQMGYCCSRHDLGALGGAARGERGVEEQRLKNLENLRLNQRRVTNCME